MYHVFTVLRISLEKKVKARGIKESDPRPVMPLIQIVFITFITF